MAVAKNEYIFEIKIIDGQVKARVDGLTKGFVKLETAVNKVKTASNEAGSATDELGKKNLQLMSKAGLAGATLTEVGRTISDLPYGIRGVANNLSQLSTLFVTLISTTGGLKNAMKLLSMQIMGPLGIILAFQAALAALDHFAGGTKKVTDAIGSFGNKFGESTAKLITYKSVLNDATISAKEKRHVLKEVTKETGGLNVELDENNQLTSESTRLLDDNIDKLKEQAEVRAIVDRLTELNTDKLKLEFELSKQAEGQYDRFLNSIDAAGAAITRFPSISDFLQLDKLEGFAQYVGLDEIKRIGGDLEDVNEEISSLLEKLTGRSLNIFAGLKKNGKERKIIDDFNIYFTKQQDALYVASARTEIKRLKELNNQKSNLLLVSMNKRVAKEKSLRDKDIISEEDFLARKADLYALYLNQISELNKKTDEDILAARLEAFMQGMDKVVGIGDQLLEAEVTREERKTVLMNNQLKEQLRNESLSAKERENINKQIQLNEEALAKKRDELAEKQFKLNKAASIASALVNTYLAATDVLAREKGGLVSKTVAMVAVIATGLAQVAAIARQQFVPSAINAGGGASGAGSGASIEAPDFNVVGASQTSQLAETVAGQQAKPVKAFVVGKDISTQQELDRNITTTASIG